ncbi:MAG: DUF4242 domain-containing protein [Chloroflexi bacterium]|nr:DUF4242 domain-containing protein [Chloroflexota bacterium]MQC19452.1 DUF4242 domain-containing protein [Chloroflexota bacterium]
MPLFLIETALPEGDKDATEALIDRIAGAAKQGNGELIEVQVGVDAGRVYAILEHRTGEVLEVFLKQAGLEFDEVAPVRLVGAELEDVKAKKSTTGANYLVEWDIPAGITMDQYLNRKREKAPLYANVPEAQFLRTYVREDMVKCLCFYDAPDEDAVRRARDAVDTPIDRLTRLG